MRAVAARRHALCDEYALVRELIEKRWPSAARARVGGLVVVVGGGIDGECAGVGG